jgi:dissimilatory sulfite reductase (desulfoviridin) alpha/beta subunit
MHSISEAEVRTLKAKAMIAEKGRATFSVRLGVVGGHLGAAQLRAIAELAERFGDGTVHLTTRQGVEIPHVPFEGLEELRGALDEAGLKLAAAGKCVRGITACPGGYCACGVIDTQRLAQELHVRVGSRSGLPHKFKIAITGCRNSCVKPIINDLGIMGVAHGFAVFVGGKVGKQPRWGDRLPMTVPDEAALFQVIDAVLDFYVTYGHERERFGTTLDRTGLDRLIEFLPPPAVDQNTAVSQQA